jgi:hypothetical protein
MIMQVPLVRPDWGDGQEARARLRAWVDQIYLPSYGHLASDWVLPVAAPAVLLRPGLA